MNTFDKAGSPWVLDKERKKFRRVIRQILEREPRFKEGDVVNYDGGAFVTKAKIIKVVSPSLYIIETNGIQMYTSENNLF